jgi:hypothetical protein
MTNQNQNVLKFIFFSLLFITSLPAAAQLADQSGIYFAPPTVQEGDSNQSVADLSYEGVDGVLIRVPWNILEKTKDNYDWTLIDSYIIGARDAHKKISIGIISGIYAPNWIHAPKIGFYIAQRRCEKRDIYFPWADNYIASYIDLMRAVKHHLESLSAYDNLRIVKMSAIAQQTLELRLPRDTDTADLCTRPVEDSFYGYSNNQIWRLVGYRPSKVMAAYSEIVTRMSHIFYGKVISQALLEVQGLPPINENGEILNPNLSKTGDDLVNTGIRILGNKFAAQNTNLSNLKPINARIPAALAAGASLGWQTNFWQGNDKGAGCMSDITSTKKNSDDCDAEGYQATMTRGIESGAKYIEVWDADIQQFSEILLRTSKVLNPLDRAPLD